MFIEIINNILYSLQFVIVGSFCFRMTHRFNMKKICVIGVALITITVVLHYVDEVLTEGVIILLYLLASICLIYGEEKRFLLTYTLAVTTVFSLINLMTDMMVLSISSLIIGETEQNGIHDMCSLVISLAFWLLIGVIVRCKSDKGFKAISWKYMLMFSIILLIDNVVVLGLGDFALSVFEKNVLYRIMYIVVVIGIFFQLAMVIWFMLSREVYREKELITQKYLDEQVEHYSYLENRERETKKFRHDIKKHMHMLTTLYQQQDYEVFDKYMMEINGRIDQFGSRISVDNGIADAILNRYYREAEKKNIVLQVKGCFPSACRISAYDLCTILSNLLSNAIRAEEEYGGNEIFVECRYTTTEVMIKIENDYDTLVKDIRGKLKTSKRDIHNHGFGLENVAECVERNHGHMNIKTENGKFRVLLDLKNNRS